MNMDFKNKINHEESCGCENSNDFENLNDHNNDCGCESTKSNHIHEKKHDHDHEHTNEDDCGCGNDGLDHDEHQGCACEQGLLEDIDNVKEEQSKKTLAILGIGAIIFVIGYYISTLSFNLTSFIDQHLISQIIYLAVVVIVGREVLVHGVKSFLNKEVKIDFLITIATVGAFLLGDGGKGATLMILFFLAEYLEHYSLDRSKRSLSKLVKLSPDVATVKRNVKTSNGEMKIEEVEVNVKDLSIGDIVIVKPGDKITIDGNIIKGIISVDQSSITGESLSTIKS